MASWKEIERIRKDAKASRTLARELIRVFASDAFSEWETSFLEAIAALPEDRELTLRQGEKLLEIRDGFAVVDQIRGFSVPLLIRQVYEARLDLEDADETWIVALWQDSPASIRKVQAGRLLRCAKHLGLIERDAA